MLDMEEKMSGRWATTQWKRCESWRCIEVWRTGEETLQECKSRLYKGCGFFVSLQDRANIANKAKGDLFVSIHTNSVDKKSPSRYTVTGSETYTLGLHRSNENLEVAKRENSVIELEDDYSAKYQGFDPNSAESYIILN